MKSFSRIEYYMEKDFVFSEHGAFGVKIMRLYTVMKPIELKGCIVCINQYKNEVNYDRASN